jgi:hypothetical protein
VARYCTEGQVTVTERVFGGFAVIWVARPTAIECVKRVVRDPASVDGQSVPMLHAAGEAHWSTRVGPTDALATGI